MKICFIDNTLFQYNSTDVYSKNLRGAETVLINLSSSLNNLNHEITIINNCPKSEIINGIRWININNVITIEDYDLVISNGDCKLFKYANSKNKILFSHSIQTIEKFLRKKQFLSFIKYKPKICFISKYHKLNRSKLLYFFGSIHLKWAVDKIFQNAPLAKNIDNNLAIFTSREGRNQDLLIQIWKNHIYSKNNKLKLLINSQNKENQKYNIFNRIQQNQTTLIKEMSKSRLFLIPGHKAELFCLAAAEATEMCIPIITLGYGCLTERVINGKTGYVAKNEKDFADLTLTLFNDDHLWQSMRNYLIKNRSEINWANVANDLIRQIHD